MGGGSEDVGEGGSGGGVEGKRDRREGGGRKEGRGGRQGRGRKQERDRKQESTVKR